MGLTRRRARPAWPRPTAPPSRRGSRRRACGPSAASRASIWAKRRSNLALVPRSAASGSTSRWRARLASANRRSPTSLRRRPRRPRRSPPRPRRSPREAWRSRRAPRSSRSRPCSPSPAISAPASGRAGRRHAGERSGAPRRRPAGRGPRRARVSQNLNLAPQRLDLIRAKDRARRRTHADGGGSAWP